MVSVCAHCTSFNRHNKIFLALVSLPFVFTGAKFWKTSKTIKAVLEDDYNELELSRSSGTARARRPKSTTYIHISSGSDSDSPGLPLTRSRRQPFTGCSRPPFHQTIVTEHHIQAIVSKIDSNTEILRTIQGKVMTWSPPASSCNPTVRDILTCIICKMASTDPLVPKCCNSVLVCRECLQKWLQSSKTCPHCREDILSISDCVQFPLIRPLLNIIWGANPNPQTCVLSSVTLLWTCDLDLASS